MAEQEWGGSVPTMKPSPHLWLTPRGGKQQLAHEAKHDATSVVIWQDLILADVSRWHPDGSDASPPAKKL